MKTLTAIIIAFLTVLSAPRAEISVNGVALSPETRAALAEVYGPAPDGAYWYDPASGLWGAMGGPGIGRIAPMLDFGAPLPAGASGGGEGTMTGVFVNGREIHADELALLVSFFGYVNPGRYWLNAQMIGGYEGGSAQFDLRASAAQTGGGSGYNRDTLFGGLMSDGQCSGYLHPSGASVMTGNC